MLAENVLGETNIYQEDYPATFIPLTLLTGKLSLAAGSGGNWWFQTLAPPYVA